MGVAIIGLDLGVTTGMAWGIFNPALRDEAGLWTALARGRKTGWDQIYSEDMLEAGLFIYKKVGGQIAEWNMAGIPLPNIRVCIEDFQARPNQVRGGSRKDKLAPVYLGGVISGGLGAVGMKSMIRWYNPSLSMSKANDARLKDWGSQCRPPGKMGWVKGKQHARDACRLLAVGLDKEV